MSTDEDERAPQRSAAELWLERFAADLPWGVMIFVAIAIGGLVLTITDDLTPAEYLSAVATGSGLLAIGHGIRSGRKLH